MSDFEVWKSYIDALGILTNQYSEPFDIKVLETKNDSSVVCRYIDTNQVDIPDHTDPSNIGINV